MTVSSYQAQQNMKYLLGGTIDPPSYLYIGLSTSVFTTDTTIVSGEPNTAYNYSRITIATNDGADFWSEPEDGIISSASPITFPTSGSVTGYWGNIKTVFICNSTNQLLYYKTLPTPIKIYQNKRFNIPAGSFIIHRDSLIF